MFEAGKTNPRIQTEEELNQLMISQSTHVCDEVIKNFVLFSSHIIILSLAFTLVAEGDGEIAEYRIGNLAFIKQLSLVHSFLI